MCYLKVTLIDVGWGDSIFIQHKDQNGIYHFGLIDSNDTRFLQSSRIYLRRYFRRLNKDIILKNKPYFDFIMLSHDHSDHRAGLENIMKEFGADDYWYPHTTLTPGLGVMLDFARREKQKGNLKNHEAIEVGKPLGKFGDIDLDILWPTANYEIKEDDENNGSVVLVMRYNKWSVVLTGDAEEKVWMQIAHKIPANTRFFKVPHHGSVNGMFDGNNNPIWYNQCSKYSRLGISGDLRGKQIFPRQEVIDVFENDKRKYFRTDLQHHISFYTDGDKYHVEYTH